MWRSRVAGLPDGALFALGAREKAVEGTTEQAYDRIELLISDRHIAGKIAFQAHGRLLVTPARSTGGLNGGTNRQRRRSL
jgi:hypothetical protein